VAQLEKKNTKWCMTTASFNTIGKLNLCTDAFGSENKMAQLHKEQNKKI